LNELCDEAALGMIGLTFTINFLVGVLVTNTYLLLLFVDHCSPTFGLGCHWPGVGSKRRWLLVATLNPFWIIPTPPFGFRIKIVGQHHVHSLVLQVI